MNMQMMEESIMKWEMASGGVFATLVNKDYRDERKEYLEGKEARPIDGTDVAFMYYIDVTREEFPECFLQEGAAHITIPVQKSMVQNWGISVEELHNTAFANTIRIHKPCVLTLGACIAELSGCDDTQNEADKKMLVITNNSRFRGAITALYPSVIEEVKGKLGDFYLLPSSIHEMIAVPANDIDATYLLRMVTEINHSQVEQGDRLSDDVFAVRDGNLISVTK